MRAGPYDFIAEQGATFSRGVTWQDHDLTGWVARMHVRATVADPDIILELNDTNGRAITSTVAGDGIVTLLVDADTTAELPTGRWHYDLELEDVDGFVVRLLEGRFRVVPEVTREEP